jgi:hypothetical protein
MNMFGRDPRARQESLMTPLARGWVPTILRGIEGSDITQVLPYFASIYNPSTMAPAKVVAYVTDTAPFSVDALGQSFPVGTLWIVAMQANGNAPTEDGPSTMVYLANGIPYGSVGSGTITNTATSAVVATFSVPYNGPAATIIIPIASYPATDGITTSVTWTAGYPVTDNFIYADAENYEQWYAVPGTLPYEYTPNPDTGLWRGGTFGCVWQDPKRPKAGPNTTYANMGLNLAGPSAWNDSYFGIPDYGNNGMVPFSVWIGGDLYAYEQGVTPGQAWQPVAQGQTALALAGESFIGGIGPVGTHSSTSVGARYAQLVITYTPSPGPPPSSDNVTITVTQDGVTIYTVSATGSAIPGLAGTFPLSITIPTPPTLTTFVCTITGSTSGTFGSYELSAEVGGSPRCDIPPLMTVLGKGTAAPGGYIPSLLSSPINQQPLQRVMSGTSYSSSTPFNAAFLPTSDGWYQLEVGGTPTAGIGEDPFGWLDARTVARGHTGRPFYGMAPVGGTATIVSWSPPSPTAISSSGTTVAVNQGSKYAFASIDLPAAGLYDINFVGSEGLVYKSGFRVQYSFTDPTFVDLDNLSGWFSFVPVWEWVADLAAGSPVFGNTPPSSPSGGLVYAIGTAPTGAWAGKAGMVAQWDTASNTWAFFPPQVNSAILDDCWYDGREWHTNGTDPNLSLALQVPKATTVYLLIELYDTMFSTGAEECTVSWGLH